MANIIRDLKTIISDINIDSISLPDSKSWQDQHDRIMAVIEFVNDLTPEMAEEDDLK